MSTTIDAALHLRQLQEGVERSFCEHLTFLLTHFDDLSERDQDTVLAMADEYVGA